MQTLKSYLDQSLLVWKDSTAAARFGIILLLLICFGAIVGVGIWSAQPQYVAVATRCRFKINERIDQRAGTSQYLLTKSPPPVPESK